jgi:hypothetical protein
MYFGVITENNFEKMKTLKNLTLLSCLVLGLSLLTFSCKKDTTTPLKTLDGKFVGTYKVTGDATDYYLAFNFNVNKTFTIYEQSNLAVGTGSWVLTGDVLTGEFFFDSNPNTTFAFTAVFNPKTGEITSGSWGIQPNITGFATFTMTKQ